MVYSEPALWEAAKRAARERLGGHSARAMQLAGQLYRAAGGRYLGRKSKAQQSLTTWTRQNWTTKSGKPSRETGERYLPRRVIEQLSSAEYAATTRAKRQGTKQGKQYVEQPAAIAAKVARLKAQTNPRPRKYASAAEKQAAFRARFPTICVRVEPKTAETVQAIADASGRTQQETLLSMLKYAMTNRNWLTLGLTEHKQLPRIEEPRKENPMKRKPTPAQIAARERFAEMARSGAFKKKAAKARKKNPSRSGIGFEGYDPYASMDRLDEYRQKSDAELRYIIQDAGEAARAQRGMSSEAKYLDQVNDATTVLYERRLAREKAIAASNRSGRKIGKREASAINRLLTGRSGNPAKKTVSQKISQLTREGYPQKQAVAIALSEERAGKVRRNPISDIANIIYNQLGANRFAMMTGAKNFVAGDDFLMFSIGKNQSVYNKVRITLTPDDLYDVEFFKMNRLGDIAKEKKYEGMYAEQLPTLFTDVTGLYTSLGTMGRRSNPRASNPIILVSDKAIATKRKANPMKRKVIKEQRPFYYVVKVGQSYDGQFSSAHYSLEDVKKIAQQKADKYGAQAKITELH